MKKKSETNEGGLSLVKPNEIITKFLKTEFTPNEIKEFGGQLARCTTEVKELESEKKAKASDYTAQINNKKALAESLSNKISNGYEYENIECEVYLNIPNTGKKTIERKDNKEVVEVVDMTQDELQTKMDFNRVDN
ncbi:MAG TPA: hypothetical protein VK590_01805 [Saprospiraceae bacterium]|nr:hypothetical protein [Saprospiraceae bacterium]